MAATSNGNYIETNPTKPVNEAVEEYRVIEDGALAHYLQEREIEYHHACNIDQRRTVMGDIQKAKQLQDEEDREARILTMDQQEELKDMDGKLAEEIQEDLVQKHLKEEEHRSRRERKDKETALMMMERERRNEHHQHARDHELAKRMQNFHVTSGDRERMRDLSDEELARRLQEQEKNKMKQKKESREHIKAVVEMQDEELARFIHEREMEEAEMMHKRERKDKHKVKHKPPRGEAPPGYLPSENERPHQSDRNHPRLREEPAPSRSRRHGGSQHTPQRPPQPRKGSEETVPKSVYAQTPDSPLDHRRHSARGSASRQLDETPPQRSKSERPHRPPPPKNQELQEVRHPKDRRERVHPDAVRDSGNERVHHVKRDPEYRDRIDVNNERDPPGRRNHRDAHMDETSHPQRNDSPSDNPWTRFPQGNHQQSDRTEDISYGEGFARLTEQEAWNQDQNYRDDRRKKNKGGDCKQQ